MKNEEQETPSLSYGVIEAVDAYLKLLGTKKLPPNIATAVQAAKTEYEATAYLRPTQVALLQRCFYRARETRYEHDPLPVNVLDIAIAEELDGQPCSMLRGDEIALAMRWLAIEGPLTPEEIDWHDRTQEQLLLSGWLSQEQFMELRIRFLKATDRWRPLK
jgi:hypothetical protein